MEPFRLIAQVVATARGVFNKGVTTFLLLVCCAAVSAQSDTRASAGVETVQVRGCVIDGDHYHPIAVPIAVFRHDGTPLTMVKSDTEGRFTLRVPAGTRIDLMTPSGQRFFHGRAQLDVHRQDIELSGCLMHMKGLS